MNICENHVSSVSICGKALCASTYYPVTDTIRHSAWSALQCLGLSWRNYCQLWGHRADEAVAIAAGHSDI
jgi:hypothetical protein